MRACLAVCLLLAACAPSREVAEGEPLPANDYTSALFTIVDWGAGSITQEANLVLANADVDCGDLGWGGALQGGDFDEDTDWVRLHVIHGVALEGWLRDYPSQVTWQDSDGSWTDSTHYFWGDQGVGPVGNVSSPDGVPPGDGNDPVPDPGDDDTDPGDDETDPDDDETEPYDPDEDPGAPNVPGEDEDPGFVPPEEGGTQIGFGVEGYDEVLSVEVSNDEVLAGLLTLRSGEVSFAATKCPVVLGNGSPDGEDTAPPGEPTEPGDPGDDN